MSGWVHNLIWFALGTFLGPWLLSMVSGKSKASASY